MRQRKWNGKLTLNVTKSFWNESFGYVRGRSTCTFIISLKTLFVHFEIKRRFPSQPPTNLQETKNFPSTNSLSFQFHFHSRKHPSKCIDLSAHFVVDFIILSCIETFSFVGESFCWFYDFGEILFAISSMHNFLWFGGDFRMKASWTFLTL